ncbi:MAG: TonB-dependent receptor [Pseudomonadota bacterium]
MSRTVMMSNNSTIALYFAALALAGGVDVAAAEDPAPEARPPLETVVVTATRTEQRQREAAIRTDVIGDNVLKGSGSRNLADAISYLPLARSENNCQNCNTTEIQLLGLPGAYNQILFDGLPLFTGVASVYGVEQIPAPLVKQIEVLKGGASALYGPGAVAGVVNVIPIRPTEDGLKAYAVREDRQGEPFTSFGALGTKVSSDGRAAISAFAQVDRQNPLDLNDDAFTELVDRDLVTAGFLSRLAVGETSEFLLNYQFTGEERRGGNRLDQPAFLSNVAEDIETDLHRGALSFRSQWDAQTRIEAIYGLSTVDRATFYGGLCDVETDPTEAGFDQQAFDAAVAVSRNQFGATDDRLQYAELRVDAQRGAHSVNMGLQYRDESVTDDNQSVDGNVINVLLDERFSVFGLFAQDEWTLSEKLRVFGGLRADKSSEVDDVILSPRVGLWYSPDRTLVLRANLSTGFRAPEVFNEDVHIDTLGADPIRTRNAPDLVEERSTSMSIGFDLDPEWRDGIFSFDGQAYVTRLDDTFFLGDIQTDATGGLFQVRSNAGRSQVLGAELTANARPTTALQLSASVAYVDARFDDTQIVFEEGTQQVATDRYLKTPNWVGAAQALYVAPRNWDLFAGLRFTGPMSVLDNNAGELVRTDNFIEMDLSATRHIETASDLHLDVAFGVRNAFDSFQDDLQLGANRDSDFVYGPRLPRTFFVSLTLEL